MQLVKPYNTKRKRLRVTRNKLSVVRAASIPAISIPELKRVTRAYTVKQLTKLERDEKMDERLQRLLLKRIGKGTMPLTISPTALCQPVQVKRMGGIMDNIGEIIDTGYYTPQRKHKKGEVTQANH